MDDWAISRVSEESGHALHARLEVRVAIDSDGSVQVPVGQEYCTPSAHQEPLGHGSCFVRVSGDRPPELKYPRLTRSGAQDCPGQ
eukprot:288450-Prymnesium_polylepis.2